MEPLDRHFGKELSNFVDHGFLNRHRNKNSVLLGQKLRGVSIDDVKVHSIKNAKEEVNQNISYRVEKRVKEKESPR